MLAVLSEVERTLGMICADQFGALVKVFVIFFELRVTFIRRQPTELVSVVFAARDRASLSLLHTFQKITWGASVRPRNGFGIGVISETALLALLEDADCLVFVLENLRGRVGHIFVWSRADIVVSADSGLGVAIRW